MAKEHPYEIRAKLLREYVESSIKRLRESMSQDGRPAFFTALTEKQELAMYLNPATRADLEEAHMIIDGPEGYGKWRESMEKKVAKWQESLRERGS